MRERRRPWPRARRAGPARTRATAPGALFGGWGPRLLGGVVLIVLVVATTEQVGRENAGRSGFVLPAVVALVAIVVLAWRRPWAGWWASIAVTPMIGWLLPHVGDTPWAPAVLVAHLLVVFLVGTVADRLPLTGAVLVAAVVFAGGILLTGTATALIPVGVAVLAGVAALAALIGTQRRTAAQLREARRAVVVEESRRAVVEERARIAREMHDVVAHQLSRIEVRARSAPARLGGVDDRVTAELDGMTDDARRALADLRRVLGVLRGDDAAPREPVPGLADLPALVEDCRDAGVDVTLAARPDVVVAPDLGLAGYRIVQEAISNAARHAPGAPVRVELHRGHDRLRIAVDNERATPPPAARTEPTGGLGLVGMRERAHAVGGTLVAGPDRDGGWSVHAALPLVREPGAGPDRAGEHGTTVAGDGAGRVR